MDRIVPYSVWLAPSTVSCAWFPTLIDPTELASTLALEGSTEEAQFA